MTSEQEDISPATSDDIIEAIEATDTDALLRIIDGFCSNQDWGELLSLRSRCAEALTRGRQLWGVDEHIRYRLALDAPASWAGPVIDEGPTRFTLGSLPETAASTKTWAELEPHLEVETGRRQVAAERAARGEEVPNLGGELPPRLESWEPSYPVPLFHSDRVDTPTPDLPQPETVEDVKPGEVVDDPAGTAALESLVHPWLTESNGVVSTACVEGDGLAAVAALGLKHVEAVLLVPGAALAWMAWAAATGGAHGRRPGLAAGRAAAWFVVNELSDLDWPPGDRDLVGAALRRLKWWRWSDGGPDMGWSLHLAIADPDSGLAWAMGALDAD